MLVCLALLNVLEQLHTLGATTTRPLYFTSLELYSTTAAAAAASLSVYDGSSIDRSFTEIANCDHQSKKGTRLNRLTCSCWCSCCCGFAG